MVDNLNPSDRHKAMKAVKGKGTKLEKKLFAMLAGMRISGWRKNVSTIEGKPDIVFPLQKLTIFIDGCFWHGCPTCNKKLPKTNEEYWIRKIKRNVELANQYNLNLIQEGWTVIRIWEHEINDPKAMLVKKKLIIQALKKE